MRRHDGLLVHLSLEVRRRDLLRAPVLREELRRRRVLGKLRCVYLAGDVHLGSVLHSKLLGEELRIQWMRWELRHLRPWQAGLRERDMHLPAQVLRQGVRVRHVWRFVRNLHRARVLRVLPVRVYSELHQQGMRLRRLRRQLRHVYAPEEVLQRSHGHVLR